MYRRLPPATQDTPADMAMSLPYEYVGRGLCLLGTILTSDQVCYIERHLINLQAPTSNLSHTARANGGQKKIGTELHGQCRKRRACVL